LSWPASFRADVATPRRNREHGRPAQRATRSGRQPAQDRDLAAGRERLVAPERDLDRIARSQT
jgi:hypothetical protein